MTKNLLLILAIAFAPICRAESRSEMPDCMWSLYHGCDFSEVTPINVDTVYKYLWQDQSRGESMYFGAEPRKFFTLKECELDGVPILIYMMIYGNDVSVYACTHPMVTRYPSTILLGEYKEGPGVREWYKINDGVISTYKLCDYWECESLSQSDYMIKDGKFVQVDSNMRDFYTRDENGSAQLSYKELYELYDFLRSESSNFIGLRNKIDRNLQKIVWKNTN